jgi:hypothetical protein
LFGFQFRFPVERSAGFRVFQLPVPIESQRPGRERLSALIDQVKKKQAPRLARLRHSDIVLG